MDDDKRSQIEADAAAFFERPVRAPNNSRSML